MNDEPDIEFAIDAVFRAAHGAERALRERSNLFSTAAGITIAKEELKRRGWKWQPDTRPTVVKTED